jgi:hypothetical protein
MTMSISPTSIDGQKAMSINPAEDQDMWLLIWEAEYGDEGEGREYVAVFDDEQEAQMAADSSRPPEGYSTGGGYVVCTVKRIARS